MTTNTATKSVVYAGPTIGGLTLRLLARFPSTTAFSWDGGSLTYHATLDLIGRMQAVFAAAGFARHARVALLSANRAEVWCAGVAAQALGMSTMWLHPLGALADQLDQLDQGEADALIVDADSFRDRGGELSARCTRLRETFTLGRAEFGVDLLAAAAKAGTTAPRDLAHPDDIAALNFTGGTTGKAKAAVRGHDAVCAVAAAIMADFEMTPRPHFLANAPISHVGGSMILPILARGGTVRLAKGFDPERELSIIARERIDTLLLVPTMIYALLDHPALAKADLSSLQLLLYGASPMAPTRLIEGIERLGPIFSQFYGQTECYPVTVMPRRDHDPRRPELFSACGFPVTGVDVQLVDADDRPVATGESGEICVRANSVIREYFRRPDLTAEAMRNGWLHTGDVARMDEEGRLYIVDRRSDLIITGGFNVYPREVEDALAKHPAVAMSAVVGLPHEHWGEAVTAYVVLRDGHAIAGDELMTWVKQTKSSAHAPKHVEFVSQLPLTPVGKVDKKQLRAAVVSGKS